MQQLTAMDLTFLALEDDATYGHVGSLAILDPSTAPGGVMTLEHLGAMLTARLGLLPPMTRKLLTVPFSLDRPYWVEDEKFDLGYHLRELALPAPGSDAQLAEQVARIFSRHLDRRRPLWETYLIHGLPDGRVAFLTKMHHSAVDGMSGQEVMAVLFDLGPEGRPIDVPADLRGAGDRPGTWGLLARTALKAPGAPFRMARRLPALLPHIDVPVAMIGLPGSRAFSKQVSVVRNLVTGNRDGGVIERPVHRAPQVSFGGKISPHRKFSFGQLSLKDVKVVKDHFGVKVNDVVVTLVAGAVRDWLIAHDDLPEKPLLAQIPVSVRTEEQRGTFGNRVSVMIVPIPTNVDGAAERVQAASLSLLAAKDRHNAVPAQALQDVATFIPPAVHARATRVLLQLSAQKFMPAVQNLVISNVPGPPIPIYLGGARLEALYPVSIIVHGTGLNVTIMSYLDHVDVGIVADREQMPDLDDLVTSMQSGLAELVALARAKTPAQA